MWWQRTANDLEIWNLPSEGDNPVLFSIISNPCQVSTTICTVISGCVPTDRFLHKLVATFTIFCVSIWTAWKTKACTFMNLIWTHNLEICTNFFSFLNTHREMHYILDALCSKRWVLDKTEEVKLFVKCLWFSFQHNCFPKEASYLCAMKKYFAKIIGENMKIISGRNTKIHLWCFTNRKITLTRWWLRWDILCIYKHTLELTEITSAVITLCCVGAWLFFFSKLTNKLSFVALVLTLWRIFSVYLLHRDNTVCSHWHQFCHIQNHSIFHLSISAQFWPAPPLGRSRSPQMV